LKPDNRKFYQTTYIVEILSETSIPEYMDLKDVLEESEYGSYSSDIKSQKTVEVDAKTMTKLLIDQRIDPSFFDLDFEEEVA